MGRKKIYITEEERKEAQRRWNMEYYERNKEKMRQKEPAIFKHIYIDMLNLKLCLFYMAVPRSHFAYRHKYIAITTANFDFARP